MKDLAFRKQDTNGWSNAIFRFAIISCSTPDGGYQSLQTCTLASICLRQRLQNQLQTFTVTRISSNSNDLQLAPIKTSIQHHNKTSFTFPSLSSRLIRNRNYSLFDRFFFRKTNRTWEGLGDRRWMSVLNYNKSGVWSLVQVVFTVFDSVHADTYGAKQYKSSKVFPRQVLLKD